MESTSAYIVTIITALVFLLIATFIANAIRFEGGSRPRDPQKRKTWFWILAIVNPIVSFVLGYFVFKPDANVLIVARYMTALAIGTGIGFVVYIVIGYILSRMFPNGKIGHWF
jgi:sulfoxide reductase heme-binding subunit YedZ